jgi:Ca-activated chloride channel homolog
VRFGNPYFLGLIWLIPAIGIFYVWAFRKKKALIERFVSDELRDRLLTGVSFPRQRLKASLFAIGCAFTILSLLQPQWGFHWEEIQRRGVDIMIALDTSKSMLAEDISPNRIERAKRKISDFLKIVEGDRIGLIAFAGTAFLQCPLTLDQGAVQIFLDTVDTDLIPVPGTAISEAISLAIQSFQKSERNSRALLLITDGEETTGSDLEAAKKANEQGIKVYTIGIGKEEGAPIPNKEGGGFKKDRQGNVVLTKLDEQGLQKLALETGGSYVRSVSGDLDLEKIYADLKKNTEEKELKSGRQKRFEERFQWPLLLAFLCFFFEAVLSERKGGRFSWNALMKSFGSLKSKEAVALALILTLLPQTLLASSATKGEGLYEQKKYNEALKELVDAQIEHPNSAQLKYNTADAYYKTNQFQEAEKLFQSVAETGDPKLSQKAYYNLGHTMYRQGKLQEALANYQKATELDPKDEDAKYNLEFVRKEIRRRMNENKNRQNQQNQPDQSKNAENQKEKNDSKGKDGDKKTAQNKDEKKENGGAGKPDPKKDEKKDGAEAQGAPQGPAKRMSEEEAKQWLSTLKESDRAKFKKSQDGEGRQYEVEKDW